MKLSILLLWSVCALCAQSVSDPAEDTTGSGGTIVLSPNGKFLINSATKHPVFLVGEQAWTLITELKNADVETYLSDRAARGYNAIWLGAADNVYQSHPPQNYYGNVPFDGADFTNEDPTYWAHVDYILKRLASYGMVALLDPGFVGLNSSSGYLSSYLNSSRDVMTAYGHFLGHRYKDYPNIIWSLGGDADPYYTASYENLAALAGAIKAVDPVHLITFEASRYSQKFGGGLVPYGGYSSLVWPGPPSWLDLNWVYSIPVDIPANVAKNYRASPWLPPFMGEDYCENEHSMTEMQVRQESYLAILSGAYLGRVFCNNPIWCLGNQPNCTSLTMTWQSQLTSPGSTAHQYLGALFQSRQNWKLQPDLAHRYLTAGYGSGPTYSVLARTSGGETMIAYFSDGNAAKKSINMAGITDSGGKAKCWWYNPSTGAAHLLGTLPNSGTHDFSAPNGNDWVLVIDSNAAALPAPGTQPL